MELYIIVRAIKGKMQGHDLVARVMIPIVANAVELSLYVEQLCRIFTQFIRIS